MTKASERVRLLVRFTEHGFVCLVVGMIDETSTSTPKGLRNINGYLAVRVGHPWHGLDYDNINAEVHGGLTFAANIGRDGWLREIADDLAGWHVVGFDCAHAGDLYHCEVMEKRHPEMFPHRGDVWRDENYVADQLRNLARQAAEVDGPVLPAETIQ